MFRVPKKRMASEVPSGSKDDKKKTIKLSHTVRSIVDCEKTIGHPKRLFREWQMRCSCIDAF